MNHVQKWILNNAAATGSLVEWPGGQGIFVVVGTFNGATVTLQFQGPDGSTLVTVGASTTLTAPGSGLFTLHPCKIQATITAGPPSGLFATAERIPV